MYSIYDQINNRKVLVYPERTTVDVKTTNSVVLTNEQIASTYFPEDIDVKPEIYFDKVEVGEGNYIYHGDNIQVLKTLSDNSIDSCITDGPYGLKFMGKNWDEDVPSVELWKEVYRVLKPGGYLLSFGAAKTYHRMATRVEDAGFEIRDQLMWVYGSGFPHSRDIGKDIDKRGGESIGWFGQWLKEWREENNIPQSKVAELFPSKNGGLTGCVSNWELENNLPTNKQFNLICSTFDLPFKSLKEAKRKYIGTKKSGIGKAFTKDGWGSGQDIVEITKGQSKWEGWGTNLKPAHEPIVMARKPVSEKTIAENVLRWGTGGINISDCRIPFEDTKNPATNPLYRQQNDYKMPEKGMKSEGVTNFTSSKNDISTLGRFPANIMFDEEAGQVLDEQSGNRKGWSDQNHNSFNPYGGNALNDSETKRDGKHKGYNDNGGASRFFYCPKTSSKDRDEGLDEFEPKAQRQSSGGSRDFNARCASCGKKFIGSPETICFCENPITDNTVFKKKNNHPTVKPTKLMQYLIRLVTPIGGITIDPYFGSGSSGKSTIREDNDYKFIGIEKEKEYFNIAVERCQFEHEQSLKVAA
jgi:site-specific DNA-methyltransferase (adenine-specific)